MPIRSSAILGLVVLALGGITPTANAADPTCSYDAGARALSVTTAANRHFRFVFNPGGAISGIYDLDLAPETSLIGDSFQGETTDRVIQWTYWNARYLGAEHSSGDKDRRANVTMEGCFHGKLVCEVLETPRTGTSRTLTFRSRIRHWFYSELDRHGAPDFETTSRYEVLEDGSLRLERAVLRHPWPLRNVRVRSWDGSQWLETEARETTLVAEQLWPGSMTSYLESWIPLRRSALPRQRHGKGPFDQDGYKFWKPQDLGGWVMAHGDQLALGVVFGAQDGMPPPARTRVVFNKLDLPEHNLNVLLPGVETDWPDNATLTQTLVFVVGRPDEVTDRASRLPVTVPLPTLRAQEPPHP